MLNRMLIFLGVPLVLIGMPFLLFNAMNPILDAYIYHPDSIALTSVFSIVPFLSWFWFLSIIGFVCICFNKRPELPKVWSKYLGTYIPCFLFVIGVVFGTIGKGAIKKHLVDSGYFLIATEKIRTSFYISLDKEIYHRAD